jgi:hypothetical protein
MDRELTSNYSLNSSGSRISYESNINNFIHDSNIYNQANLIEMLRNIHQEDQNIVEENSIDNSLNSYELFNEMSYLPKEELGQSNSYISKDELFEDPNYLILNTGRAATAPTKPLNETEEFKWSSQYINLERCVIYSNKLIVLQPESKFDVDSEEGNESCKKLLEQLEKLIKVKFYINLFI